MERWENMKINQSATITMTMKAKKQGINEGDPYGNTNKIAQQ